MTQPRPASDLRVRGARIAFWVVAPFGVLAAAVAWNWYALAQFEAQSEQSKALSAQTTMAGFAEVWGGVPLVLAHIVGLATLLVLGWKGYRDRGIGLAIAAVFIASVAGIGVAQLLWDGQLFQLGIDNDVYVP
ncbi:MAG: hypothetical protein ACQEW8_07960 [Actinomycetota bacterium]